MMVPVMMVMPVSVPVSTIHYNHRTRDHHRSRIRIHIHDASRRPIHDHHRRRIYHDHRRRRHMTMSILHPCRTIVVDHRPDHGTCGRTDNRTFRPAVAIMPADQRTRHRTDNRRIANDRRTIMLRLHRAHRSHRQHQGNKYGFHDRAL